MQIQTITGKNILNLIDDVARLRIAVFREFPYLYEGSLDYEKHYLEKLSESESGVVVAARDGSKVVGASTALPMVEAEGPFQKPFVEAGADLSDYFYFAESVLLPEYRGRGLGREFFRRREAHADNVGEFKFLCFCAVDRPQNHPERPKDYRPLDTFWESEDFFRRPDLRTTYQWLDRGDGEETEKPMTFWVKDISKKDRERT